MQTFVATIPPALICQNHRLFDLAIGNCPINLQEPILLVFTHQQKTVFLVKANGPRGSLPSADQNWPSGKLSQVSQHFSTDTLAAQFGAHVSMPDQSDIGDVLDTHHGDEMAICPMAVKR